MLFAFRYSMSHSQTNHNHWPWAPVYICLQMKAQAHLAPTIVSTDVPAISCPARAVPNLWGMKQIVESSVISTDCSRISRLFPVAGWPVWLWWGDRKKCVWLWSKSLFYFKEMFFILKCHLTFWKGHQNCDNYVPIALAHFILKSAPTITISMDHCFHYSLLAESYLLTRFFFKKRDIQM